MTPPWIGQEAGEQATCRASVPARRGIETDRRRERRAAIRQTFRHRCRSAISHWRSLPLRVALSEIHLPPGGGACALNAAKSPAHGPIQMPRPLPASIDETHRLLGAGDYVA